MKKVNKGIVIASTFFSCAATFHLANASTPLADYPVLGSVKTPGNLALALSVEYPTALTTAHQDSHYNQNTEYLGYFDPKKCYSYIESDTNNLDSSAPKGYFKPEQQNQDYKCNGSFWNGNFLNWATTSTIDPFRWAMTGGRRVVDTPSITILEKSYHSAQGSFPDKYIIPANNNDSAKETSAQFINGFTPIDGHTLQIKNNGLGYNTKFIFTKTAIEPVEVPIIVEGKEDFTYIPSPIFTASYYKLPNNTSDEKNMDRFWSDSRLQKQFPGRHVNNASTSGSRENLPNLNDYASQFTGTFTPPATGIYYFGLTHDDYGQLQIKRKNQSSYTTLISGSKTYTSDDPASMRKSGGYEMTKGTTYDIQVRHFDTGGPSHVRLYWKVPGSENFQLFSSPQTGSITTQTPSTTIRYDKVERTIEKDLRIRVQVCDSNIGLEENCKKYSEGYKPEGLIQQYADEMRYSAFGYLNDHSATRDGGVMRAKMKSVGPRDFNAAANDALEWDPITGVLKIDPDNMVPASGSNPYKIQKSGVINYLNDFGQLTTNTTSRYKAIDPVGEMYYGILRYFRGQHDIPAWSDVSNLSDNEKIQAYDGFPIFSTRYQSDKAEKDYPSWKNEAILLSCQKNFILGIGDTNTHKDKNLPSTTTTGSSWEPSKPQMVKDDKFVDVVSLTTKVGNLESINGIKNWTSDSWNGNHNSPYMAGLAYHANFFSQRPDMGDGQTVQTFWVDVMENNDLKNPEKNQFYLAAKYGGIDKSQIPSSLLQKIKTGTEALNSDEHKLLTSAAWTAPMASGSTWAVKRNNQDYKPRSFFTAGNPKDMVDGLSASFENFSAIINAYSTTLSLSTQNLSSEYVDESMTYSASYHSNGWRGDITARKLIYDDEKKSFTLGSDPIWKSSEKLAAQFAGDGWNTKRNIVTSTLYADSTKSTAVPFRHSKITSYQQSLLKTNFATTNTTQSYLNWLRGDESKEGTDYRKRTVDGQRVPIADIINSKIQVVGAPNQNYSELENPGYKDFKKNYAKRETMIYVGANDGMLHAIRGGEHLRSGEELFAYIPSALFEKRPQDYGTYGLLSHLGNPNYVHKNYVDATPRIFDIDFNSAGKSKADVLAATADKSYQPEWHSVLIGGLGSGGRSYYAIDVTDPQSMDTEAKVASKVLWEFPAKADLPEASGGLCKASEKCIDMGYSFADPVVVKTLKWGWVTIFTSGYNNVSGKGHIFIVNPATGELLEEITTGTRTATGMTHATAYVPDYSTMTAESLYVGDLDGQLWRFDLSGAGDNAYPEPALLASVGKDATSDTPNLSTQPITSKPLVEVHPITRQRYVMFGTGKLLHGNDVQFSHKQGFYAIQDGTVSRFAPAPESPITAAQLKNVTPVTTPSTDTGGDTSTPQASATVETTPTNPKGWYLSFGEDMWRLVSDPISSQSLIAFSAVQPLGEHCKPSGQSRVYILDFANGKTRITDDKPFIYQNAAVTELSFLRVGDKLRLTGGDAEGSVTTFGHMDPSLPARNLGWREIPVAQ